MRWILAATVLLAALLGGFIGRQLAQEPSGARAVRALRFVCSHARAVRCCQENLDALELPDSVDLLSQAAGLHK